MGHKQCRTVIETILVLTLVQYAKQTHLDVYHRGVHPLHVSFCMYETRVAGRVA